MPKSTSRRAPLYAPILERIFLDRYRPSAVEIPFTREDIVATAKALKLPRPGNLGDVVYSRRYRVKLPPSVLATQPVGSEWTIEGTGRAKYAFRLSTQSRIEPNDSLITNPVGRVQTPKPMPDRCCWGNVTRFCNPVPQFGLFGDGRG